MLGPILITIIPTLLLYIILPKLGFAIKSNYLRIAFSWFAGMYIFTIASFLLATLLSPFTTSVLLKASLEILAAFTIILFFYFHTDLKHLGKNFSTLKSAFAMLKPLDMTILFFCFAIPLLFFSPHLLYEKGAIYTTPVFWDFHWLMSLTQTFAYGDNFPPQNEAFAGLPANYHYFWMVITAIYEVMGLNLIQAINSFSIFSFSFFLIALIGISQDLFHSKLAGVFAILLTITSSSGHFADYVLKHQNQTLTELLVGILTNNKHPFFSTIFATNGVTYNGTMFNLFYFIEERQMILGVIYLICCTWIIYNRKTLSRRILLITGAFMGAYFLWHLYITIMVLAALAFILIFDNEKKKTLFLLGGFGAIFLPLYLYFKQLTNSEWFNVVIKTIPKFEPGFSDQRGKPFSFQHAFVWYGYSYGIKMILLPIGLIWLWFKNRKAALLFLAILVPTFSLINTVQLSPADVYENHKWLRPMNIIVDLTIAALLVSLFFKNLQRSLSTLPAWALILFLLTASGFLELMPYFNSKPSRYFALYPSPITEAIEINTPPKAVFVSRHDNEVFLAGRKLFLANQLRGHDTALNRKKRTQIITQLYSTKDLPAFCSITKTYGIDYVEFMDANEFFLTLPHFSALNQGYQMVSFADAKKACSNKPYTNVIPGRKPGIQTLIK